MVSLITQITLTFLAFVMGYRVGMRNQLPNICIPDGFWENINKINAEYTSSKSVRTGQNQPSDQKNGGSLQQQVEFESTFVHSNSQVPTLQSVFSMIHHASCPVRTELILTQRPQWNDDFSMCDIMYATRSPVREDQTNRCMAVARIENENDDSGNSIIRYTSLTDVSHRLGIMTWPQKLTNQYQDDIIHKYSFDEEFEYTSLFLKHRVEILSAFRATMGESKKPNGQTRTIVIMIANEGVMDLLLNLLCSAQAIPTVDMNDFVVFVGQPEHIAVVESLGARAFFHEALGTMPRHAAALYADRTFAKIMWLKVTAVYIAVNSGFNSLFQDVDLVWMRNPIPYLDSLVDYDLVFMDDGARTPRFSPYFTNTGFYLVRHNERSCFMFERLIRSVGEISYTASHQATLIRHLTESIALVNLQIKVLPDTLFPSGRMYHEQKEFVQDVVEHRKTPYVWHMCWTDHKGQKIEYYHYLGLWFPAEGEKAPPDRPTMCINGTHMLDYVTEMGPSATSIKSLCCTKGGYWAKSKA